MWSREPIADVLARPDLDAGTRERLETVVALRAFARDSLGLDVGGAYSSYAEVPPGALLWVVSAAERTRLRPYEWWFPIVGSVTYKGFFSRDEAEREGERLRGEGYDTYVRPSVAFSTLGWFDDPVLSSWMQSSRTHLAALVLHELLHRTTYLRGQTTFNESFATFVGDRGALAFFTSGEGPRGQATREAGEAWERDLGTSERLGEAIAALERLYAEAERDGRAVEDVLAERQAIFAALGDPERINNAVILARAAYLSHLDRFERVYHACEGDLREAIARVRGATEESGEPFAALGALTSQTDGQTD